MKTRPWRPSTAFKKRRGNYLSQVEVTGVAAIFFFFVFVLMSPFLVFEDLPVRARVDLAVSTHGLPQPGALKEDAIDIAVMRDGSAYFCNTKIAPEDIADQIREKVRTGSDPNIYIRADARAKYGDVAAVIGRARLSGVDHVVLITEQRDLGLPP